MTDRTDDRPTIPDDDSARRDRLSALAELFAADGPADLEDATGPTYWPELAARDLAAAWAQLGGWLEGLIARFPHLDHHVIPLCWYRHPGHVEALSALRDHQAVSYSDTAARTAAVDWHRAFRDIEARLREWTGQLACGATHEPGPRQIGPAHADDWSQFVADDITRRQQAAIAVALADRGE
jgi:hypothetical protein